MTATLPERDLLDSRLAELLAEPGCAVCAYRQRSASRFVDAILGEMVNDRGFRRDLDEARGFCPAHTHAVIAATRSGSGGTVTAAILFGAIVSVRGRELEAAAGDRGRSRVRRLTDARRQAACPVCAEGRTAEGHAVGRLVLRAGDPGWAAALSRAEVCLDHVLALAAAGSEAPGWAAVETAQRARIADLGERLRRFAHHSSHDRRHLITDEERRSADEAARLLRGAPSGE